MCSWFGSLIILSSLWIQVKIDVKINEWFGVFYDMIQKALAKPNAITIEEYWSNLASFITLAGIYIALYVAISFFTAHYLFLSEQLDVLGQLQSTYEDKLRSISVAYEPIWAIGSGLNAEKDYIEETHKFVKKYLNDQLGWGQLDIYPAVLYGGSVNLVNCEEIISSNDVDGLLIGGASLNSETFSKIYNLS